MKKTGKFLAVLLAITLVNTQVSAIQPSVSEESVSATRTVISEKIALREQNVKHFLLSDNTYTAVVYDEPVHYKQGNEWLEIDNSLVSASLVGEPLTGTIKRDSELTVNEKLNISQQEDNSDRLYNNAYYENNANDFKIQIPKEINRHTPIVVNYEGHSLRFCFNDITNTAAQVIQPMNAAETEQKLQNQLEKTTDRNLRIKIQNDYATAVQKNRSAVSYPSVKSNIDLNYYVCGQNLKEDIVFRSLPSSESFSFDFAYTGLSAVLEEDKSVVFYDVSGKSVFVIAAPFMFDSGEGYSSDILVTLAQTDIGCRYTLTPDREWLEDEARVYPITLDPQVTTTQNASYIHDNGVQQSDPNTNYITADRMYVGSGPNSTQGRIYFKLTQWPSATGLNASTIASAFLNLNYYPQASWQTAYQTTFDVYTVSSSWDTNTITWNNQTGIGGTRISRKFISDSRNKTSGYDAFDVTSWVQSHYSSPSTDYGIRIQPYTVGSTINRACYISSDYYANTSLRPVITIEYYATPNSNVTINHKAAYCICNANSGNYLDIQNAVDANGQNVLTRPFNGSASQRWRAIINGNHVSFINAIGSFSRSLNITNNNADIYYNSPSYPEFTLIRYHNSRFFRIMFGTKYISEDSSHNVFASDSDLGASSLWSFESVFGIAAPLYPSLSTNPLPERYKAVSATSLTSSEILNFIRSSRVFISNCHGDSDGIIVGEEMTKYSVNQLPDNDLSGVKCVVFISCETGLGGESADNLVNSIYNKGAQVVIGFREEIGEIGDAWGDGFMAALRAGKNIHEAMLAGDEAGLTEWGSYENIQNRTVRGSTYINVLED